MRHIALVKACRQQYQKLFKVNESAVCRRCLIVLTLRPSSIMVIQASIVLLFDLNPNWQICDN